MTSNIQVDTHKDHIINTTPALRVDMSNIEILPDLPSQKPRIEIPERKRTQDSDSSDDAADYAFLANEKKIAPPREDFDNNNSNRPYDNFITNLRNPPDLDNRSRTSQ